jgi:hypothetical protein
VGAARSIAVMFPMKGILRGWGIGCVMDAGICWEAVWTSGDG